MSIDGQSSGVYSQVQDPVLNPAYCGSLIERIADSETRELLPSPPLGKLWCIVQANVLAEGASASWGFSEQVPGEIVRSLDVRTAAAAGSFLQAGSLQCAGPLVVSNFGLAPIVYSATVLALPTDLVQRFWLQLTNVFQAVALDRPANKVLRSPYGGFNQGTNSPMWCNNTEPVTGRALEWRFTRGVVSIVATNTATSANTRMTVPFGANVFPPLLPGDVLEARVTTVPGAPVYLGGMLQAVPQLGLV